MRLNAEAQVLRATRSACSPAGSQISQTNISHTMGRRRVRATVTRVATRLGANFTDAFVALPAAAAPPPPHHFAHFSAVHLCSLRVCIC